MTAEEAEVVTKVRIGKGCYPGGQAVSYKHYKEPHSATKPAKINFSNMLVEVRAVEDPYMMFLELNADDKDQGLFFWLSVICLCSAILMIFALGCAYKMYISEEARLQAAAAVIQNDQIIELEDQKVDKKQ